MYLRKLFSQTAREAPSEATVASHQLLLRAGFIRQLGSGIFSYLPLARRALNKIEAIMRKEIEAIGGQEVTMPVVHPARLWQESGRWGSVGPEMGRFTDRNGHDMVLAMTHEEVVADLVRREIRSYRQLPQLIYHIQVKWRDDPRPRAGLIRVREFTMLDSYSLDAGEEGLDTQYRAHYQAYFDIFHRCGLPVMAVGADTGMMGGSLAHEYMYLTPIGEDTLILCDGCGYRANRQIAAFRKPASAPEEARPIEKVATPGTATIDQLADFLKVPKSKTAKAVFVMATIDGAEQFVCAVVRGDMETSETKLANAIKAAELRPAREDEILAAGGVPGYASPIGLKALVVVDDAIPQSPNLVAGANEASYHLLNTNYGRDYRADIEADIAAAGEGDACLNCGRPLRAERGVEVGNIFKLGTRYSEALGCTFDDQDAGEKPVVMGSYGIGSGRLLACIAEEHNDEYGLSWPITVAPYHAHLIALPGVQEVAGKLYDDLWAAGIEVLYDDRDERPGVKFADADLIGLPLRVTVSERSLSASGVELKRRDSKDKVIVPLDEAVGRLRGEIDKLHEEIAAEVVEVPFEA
ncbi:MAG: proline--tRNA ligase [Anaerolineae bacterium]|nr:proline--tRNA ligase [Anaerolineae bacterium]